MIRQLATWTKTDAGYEGHDEQGRRVAVILDRGRGYWAGQKFLPDQDKVVKYVSGGCLADIQEALARPFDDAQPVGQSREYMAGIAAFQRGETCPPGTDAYQGYTFAEAHYGD